MKRLVMMFAFCAVVPANAATVSIFAHGAVCDGVHDDSAAVQAAVDDPAAGVVSFDGSAIPGWAGICLVRNITIHHNDVTLDIGSTVLSPPALATPMWMFATQVSLGISSFRIRGGTFNMIPGNGSTAPATNRYVEGIRFDACNNCSVEGTTILNPFGFQGDCLWIGGLGGPGTNGGSVGITLSGVTCAGFGRNGFSASQVTDLLVTHYMCSGGHGDPGACIDIEPNQGDRAVNVTIIDSSVMDCNIGIYLQNGKGLPGYDYLIAGNQIQATSKFGIVNNSISRSLILANTIMGPGNIGVSIGGATVPVMSDDVVFSGNNVTGFTTGVQLAGVRNLTFVRNTLPGAAPKPVPTGLVPQPVTGNSVYIDNVAPAP